MSPTIRSGADVDGDAATRKTFQDCEGSAPQPHGGSSVLRQNLATKEDGSDVARAAALRRAGRPGEAAILLEHVARTAPSQAMSELTALGAARLEAGDAAAAEAAFERILINDPARPTAHADLAVALLRQGRLDEAVAAYEQAVLLHRARPRQWDPQFPREVARLGLVYEARRAGQMGDADDPAIGALELDAAVPLVTKLVGCFGDHSDYSLRCLASVAAGVGLRTHCELLVGLNACCTRTVTAARRLADDGTVDAVVECQRNRNKDPMMRVLLEQVRTPYVLWLDDDSHFVDPNWPAVVARVVRDEHPFDVSGRLGWYGPRRLADPAYARFVRGRPWWRTDEHLPPDLREWVPFALGGLFVARTAYLRQHDFPDRGMTKAMDDVALGDLVLQQTGRLVPLPADVLAMCRIDDGHRRGVDFDLPIDPPAPAAAERHATDPAARKLAEHLIGQRRFLYVRDQDSHRELELLPDGAIGVGATSRERRWEVRAADGEVTLHLLGDGRRPACSLVPADTGVLRGRLAARPEAEAYLIPHADEVGPWPPDRGSGIGPTADGYLPRVSFVTACMNRLHHLRLTLPLNLRWAASYPGPIEFVLLDYNDRSRLADWARAELLGPIADGTLSYYRTSRPTRYDQSHAKNVLLKLATGDVIVHVDADNVIGHGFAELAAGLPSRTLLSAPDAYPSTGGRVVAHRADLLAIGGYDEASFGGAYGHEDLDLIARAAAVGVRRARFDGRYAMALPHSDGDRQGRDSDDVRTTARRNAAASAANLAAGRLVANAGRAWGVETLRRNFADAKITTQ
ncbi:MAG: hypothetical protein JWO31_1352 [Phycisphaerales bacterium]|nr:hypothetical protein [Phycisphaerales bacterium]